MNLNPTTWSLKTHVLTWLPLAAFTLSLINADTLWAWQPFVTKVSFEAVQENVDILTIFRLQDEIARLEAKRDELRESLNARPSRILQRDLNEVLRKLGAFDERLRKACDTPSLSVVC